MSPGISNINYIHIGNKKKNKNISTSLQGLSLQLSFPVNKKKIYTLKTLVLLNSYDNHSTSIFYPVEGNKAVYVSVKD